MLLTKQLLKTFHMMMKSLIFTVVIYFLIQVLPSMAGNTTQAIVNDAPVLAKVSNECSAQSIKRPTPAIWSQLFVDMNEGESPSNTQDVLNVSELAKTSIAKESVNYDEISDANIMNCHVNEVPIPAAGWLFASALFGFITFSNRHRA